MRIFEHALVQRVVLILLLAPAFIAAGFTLFETATSSAQNLTPVAQQNTPTEEPTDAPTTPPTEEPTDAPTTPPTEEPTDIPTVTPTEESTTDTLAAVPVPQNETETVEGDEEDEGYGEGEGDEEATPLTIAQPVTPTITMTTTHPISPTAGMTTTHPISPTAGMTTTHLISPTAAITPTATRTVTIPLTISAPTAGTSPVTIPIVLSIEVPAEHPAPPPASNRLLEVECLDGDEDNEERFCTCSGGEVVGEPQLSGCTVSFGGSTCSAQTSDNGGRGSCCRCLYTLP